MALRRTKTCLSRFIQGEHALVLLWCVDAMLRWEEGEDNMEEVEIAGECVDEALDEMIGDFKGDEVDEYMLLRAAFHGIDGFVDGCDATEVLLELDRMAQRSWTQLLGHPKFSELGFNDEVQW